MAGLPICTHCGFTFGEYRARGLLGCPQCYAAFGDALQGDLLWIHRALQHGGTANEDAESRAERLAHWREQLADALRKEDYAGAARLRRLIEGADGADGAAGDNRHPGPGHGR
jgi:protein arginine kinase activator